MQNQIRPLYVEAMIEDVLGPSWRYVGGNWTGWDFVSQQGAKLEVKQSAAIQPWSVARGMKTKGIFDIRERTGYFGEEGISWHAGPGRNAQIYIFAWHPVVDETADHRDPNQWRFYVVPVADLPPGRKTIGLKAIERRYPSVGLKQISDRVNTLLKG
jgi:hypothetical protein